MIKSKLITYNLNLGRNFLKRKDCLDEMLTSLSELDWDYLCLQEIPKNWQQSKVVEELINKYHYVFHSISENSIAEKQYNGIISKKPIIQSGHYDLSLMLKEARGLTWILTEDPNWPGKIIKVGCLHLGLSVLERKAQRQKIVEFFTSFKEKYDVALLSGDFNEWNFLVNPNPFNKVDLSDAYKEHNNKLAKTYPSFFPILPLDRVYVSKCEVKKCEVIKGDPWNSFSDHLPLAIEFTYS